MSKSYLYNITLGQMGTITLDNINAYTFTNNVTFSLFIGLVRLITVVADLERLRYGGYNLLHPYLSPYVKHF